MNKIDETNRRPHLTKEQRLPSCYKEVEKVLSIVKRCEANAKTALNNSRLRGSLFRKVYALTLNVLKQSRILDEIFKETQMLEKEPFLRKELAGILVHELIFGKGLPGESKPVQVVKSYEFDIQKAYNRIISDGSLSNSVLSIPKYVRVNTLVTTLPEVIEDLEYLGVKQIIFDTNCTEDEFYELVKNLERNTFLVDYHFKDLLVFHSEENLTTWSLYRKNHVFIQDKSSYIPAYVLAPTPGATVIDACAAPGMKTLHLTALMENTGNLYAFERDENRFKVLNDMLKAGSANICETTCDDFNKVDPYDEKYSSVEYILLDPSCSGSGMVSRMDSITDTKESKNDARFQKLAGFQIILLKHALHFPSVKRVVYSTCSITETENEYVVHEVLNQFKHSFKLTHVLPDWPIRGSNEYRFGSHCLRAYPDKSFTNGFFVAMFERRESYQEEYDYEENSYQQEKKNRRKSVGNNRSDFENHFCKIGNFDQTGGKITKTQSGHMQSASNDNYNDIDNGYCKTTEEEIPHKKKSKHKIDVSADAHEKGHLYESHSETGTNLNSDAKNETLAESLGEVKPHKKKNKRKHELDYSDAITINCNANYMQSMDEPTEIDNIQHDTASGDAQDKESHHKKHKKHKKEKRPYSPNIRNDIKDESRAETTEKEISRKKKSKHKKDVSANEHEDEIRTNAKIDVENSNVTESLEEVKPIKKKNKRKHKSDYSDNININGNANEIQNMNEETEVHMINDDITAVDFQDGETHHKKHKKKHKKEYYEFQSQNISVPDSTISDVTEISPSSKKHKKKHNKNSTTVSKVLIETEDNFNNDVKDSIFPNSVEVNAFHKKRKSKHNK